MMLRGRVSGGIVSPVVNPTGASRGPLNALSCLSQVGQAQ
jgi:hypothetical protein